MTAERIDTQTEETTAEGNKAGEQHLTESGAEGKG